MFSKSFGYALRGILYVAVLQDEKRKIHADEVAARLAVPRYFMGKILKKLVKHRILYSTKGPNGGFFVNEITLSTPILEILKITDGDDMFQNCLLRLSKCSNTDPCPMHDKLHLIRTELKNELSETTVHDLLAGNKAEFIRSITTI